MKSCGCLKVGIRQGTRDTRPGCFAAGPSIYCSSSFWTIGDVVLFSSILILIFLLPPPSSASFSSVSSLLNMRPLFCAAGELGHERTQLSGATGFLSGPLQLSLGSSRTWEAFSSDCDLSPCCSVFLETWLPGKHTVGPWFSWD